MPVRIMPASHSGATPTAIDPSPAMFSASLRKAPLHFDESYAKATRTGRLIIHGGLTTGLFNALVAEQLPGPGSVFLSQQWDYPAAVGIGERVIAEVEVIEARADKPVTKLRCRAWLADGTEVLRGESVVYTLLPSPAS